MLNKIFGTEPSVAESLLEEAIEKFEQISDYVVEEPKEVDDYDLNKQFKEENLAFREVNISLKNTNLGREQSETCISVIIDKDSNIICDTPYNYAYEVQDDMLHIVCTEDWTDDVWKDYTKHVPVNYGYDEVKVDINKILKQILMGIKDIQVVDVGEWYNIGIMEIGNLDLIMLLNKDTLITGIKY